MPKRPENVVEILIGELVVSLHAATVGCAGIEKRLDLLLDRVGELGAVAVEELDAVVLRRVVRGGDDGAEIEREQRDRRRRQHAAEHGRAAGRGDAARERILELRSRRARVTTHEDVARAGPDRRGPTEPFDQLGRQALADDPRTPSVPK